jgi:hypothetical protein
MIKKLRTLLRTWLGIEQMYSDIHAIHGIFNIQNKKANHILTETIALEKRLQLGVDFHPRGGSWAVVCVEGKPEYVKFIDLSKRDAEEIRHILRSFAERSGKRFIVDGVPNLPKDFFIR